MTPKRKKKGVQQKSAAKSGVEAENLREDGIPEVPGVAGLVEDLMGEAGPDEPINDANLASDENDRPEESRARDMKEARAQIEELKEQHLRARAEAAGEPEAASCCPGIPFGCRSV